MKKFYKRSLGLLLALAVILSVTMPVFAENDLMLIASGSDQWSNPLYPDAGEPDGQAEASPKLAGTSTNTAFVSVLEAEKQLRDHMRDRDATFTLRIYSPEGRPDMKTELFPAAYSEELAVGINTGDYLRWSWSKCSWDYREYMGSRYEYVVTMRYYTSASQESQLMSDLSSLMEELDLWRVSDYQKYCGIYDYITDHVDYDYAGIAEDDTLMYTAYKAYYSGTSVCQGYATLMYAMCRSMGLSVRVISGEEHAWNIVAINGTFYNMDATWDGQGQESFRNYFLKGSKNFDGHVTDEEYQTDSFRAAHPISQTDYAPTVQDTQPVSPFRDVPESSYYYDAINRVTEHGLFNGTTNYTFTPEGTMSRAMLVTVLWRMAGSPDYGTGSGFQDVTAGSYYAKAVTWARSVGVAAGVTDTQFGPGRLLTREQAAVFLYRYASTMGYSVTAFHNLSSFSDIALAGSYSIPALRWAVGAGILNGTGSGTLNPRGSATRGQMAVMMDRFMTYYKMYG